MFTYFKRVWLAVLNKGVATKQAFIEIKGPERMRWVDTCSCMAIPIMDTLKEGVVLRRYAVDNPSYWRDPKRSCGIIRLECRLEDGTIIDRFESEFHRDSDGILIYHN